MENGAFAPKEQCSIFHNIVKYMIFQRRQKELLWSKGLRDIISMVLHVNLEVQAKAPGSHIFRNIKLEYGKLF